MLFRSNLRNELITLKGWELVDEIGFVGRKEISEILGKTRIGMVTLLPTRAYVDSLPIKMFEYMAAGIPVIASNFPIWMEIIEKHMCGICVDPSNPQAIAEAVQYLMLHPEEAQSMGENGRKASLECYNWQIEAQKLTEFYRML